MELESTLRCKTLIKPRKKMSRQQLNILYLMLAAMIIGTAFGAITEGNSTTTLQSYISYLVKANIENAKTDGFLRILINCAAPYLSLLLFNLIFAYSALGIPLICGSGLFSGVCVGTVSAFLYTNMGTKGIIYNLVILMPAIIAVSLAMLKISICAVQMSANMFVCAFKNSRNESKALNTAMSSAAIKALIVVSVSAIFQALMIKMLSGFLS